jgi:hypothetical protein
MIPEKLNFITSRRFWCLVAIAILGVLQQQNILSNEIVNALILVLGGFIGLNTIDKFSEPTRTGNV